MGSPPGSAPLHAAARAFNRGQATDEDEVRPVFESISVPITVPMATLLRPPVSEEFDFVWKAWSEWQDLNLRPPRPERGALPDCATLRQKAGLITRVGKGPQARSQSKQPDDRAAGDPSDKSGTRRHYAQCPRG